MDTIRFEAVLSDVFRGGECRRRELRLSAAEADYLRARYAHARLTSFAPGGDGKNWFEVVF